MTGLYGCEFAHPQKCIVGSQAFLTDRHTTLTHAFTIDRLA